MQRWIIHIDMDAFFASVEQLDHPEWRGKPVIIGGETRGVVSTASYEARAFGVHSAMPIFQAKKLCPHGIYTRGSHRRYGQLSREIMHVLGDFSPVVEQASIDEAYLDATGLERLFGPIDKLAEAIKSTIKERVGLNCSIGAAPVKFLAKISSDVNKPNGFFVLQPEEVDAFLLALPLKRIPGMGKKSLDKLHAKGIFTVKDVRAYPASFWERNFGKMGMSFYARCFGLDEREVTPYTAPKSESAENTFASDTADREELKTWLLHQAERVGANLRKAGFKGKTVTLKIKYKDFTQITRSYSLQSPTASTRVIYEVAADLLEKEALRDKLRLIGVGVSNFVDNTGRALVDDTPDHIMAAGKTSGVNASGGQAVNTSAGGSSSTAVAQLMLPGLAVPMTKADKPESLENSIEDTARKLTPREEALDKAIDAMRLKFGKDAVVRGRLFEAKK